MATESVEEKVRHFVLQNAVEYGGKANVGSVLGKVLGAEPEFRAKVAEIRKAIENVVAEVNKLGLEKQKAELQNSGFIKEEKVEKKGIEKLPDLTGAVRGAVVMRMAPNPNGPLHIGHSRMVVLNDEYVKKYGGDLILRFDDTDPKNENKIPMKEAYQWIGEDLKWLGVKYSRVERASARLEIYYKHFEKILSMGFAYVCICDQEKWSRIVRVEGGSCPCRQSTVKENLEMWSRMLNGGLKEGHAVGRMKTHNEPDPAIRDWVTFRIIDKPEHPLVKGKSVWPMLDFASAIDDFDFGITHIVRGKDLVISEKRQRILYDYMGWKYPEVRVYGKFVTTENLVVSKSKIMEGIKKGNYTGFDDPKLAVLRAFKRRGILPQAIRNYILNLGLNEAETTVDLEILFSENRKLIDPVADRYMAVIGPVEIDVSEPLKKSGLKEAEVKYHPEKKETRKIGVKDKVFISGEDFNNLKGKDVRLIDLFNVKLDKKAAYSKSQDFGFETKKLQWVSEDSIRVRLVTPDGVKEGLGEKALLRLKSDDMIQLLRIGFGRVDSVGKDQITIYFAHK